MTVMVPRGLLLSQFNYALQLFKPVLYKELDSVDVTEKAMTRFNTWIQKCIDNSVFTQCTSWYRIGQTGRVAQIWPSAVVQFWWMTLWVKWGDYTTQGKRKGSWLFRRRSATVLRYLLMTSVVFLAGAVGTGRLTRNEVVDVLKHYVVRAVLHCA
jgi:hypothetical protein